ncbi:MAG TPA: tRNA (adenosine(37)-N6)-threonylcarbamoyltransferase complex dimerization subunit type 1 TsaB [Chroococcales cyanobacterium]
MNILSFDTSTSEIHLSLLDGAKLVLERKIAFPQENGQPRQETVSALMPAIDAIVEDAGWTKPEIDCLVVGESPGSFTGIRTTVVTARTLAQALKVPLLAVSKLECHADDFEEPVTIILSAGKGDYFAAAYTKNAGGQSSEIVKASHFRKDDLVAGLGLGAGGTRHWAADRQALQEIAELNAETTALPEIENMATRQAQIAFRRVSSKLESRLTEARSGDPGGSSHKEKPVQDIQKASDRSILLNDFPYQTVTPLYLRSPSVTIKKPAAPQ